jgi:ubiquinone/menaquinone biosynthesis C-methylase UbiE
MSANTPSPQQPDLAAIKQRQQAMWASGDYNEIGSRLLVISERLFESLDPQPGEQVLDVASGSGNAALAAARRFCDALGTDYVPDLIDRARMRAEAEGLPVSFEVADAENLPYEDASFDMVTSVIGVMFAPDQQQAAGELLRVCRPGGKIGLANWTPDSFAGELFRVIGRQLPPPPGLTPPTVWGTEEGVDALLGSGLEEMTVTEKAYTLRYLSIEHFVDFHITHFGPIKTAYDSLDIDGRQRLTSDLAGRAAERNRSGNDTIVIDSDYLEVVAVRAA